MTDPAVIPVALACALFGGLLVVAYVRWQWRPRIVVGDGDRWTIHRDRRGRVHLQAELVAECVDRLVVGVAICSDTHVVWANPAACVALGHPLSELRSVPYWERIHPDDRDKGHDAVDGDLKRRRVQIEHRNRWIAQDGTIRHLVWTASPFDDRGYTYCTIRLEHLEPPEDA